MQDTIQDTIHAWKSAEDAIKWALVQRKPNGGGLFNHKQHAENFYIKLKNDAQPETAAAMFGLWYDAVQVRLAEPEGEGEQLLDEAQQENPDSTVHDAPTAPPTPAPVTTHNEAKVIIFTDVQVLNWTLHVTAREGATEEMILETGRALVGALQKMQRKSPKVQQVAAPLDEQGGHVTVQVVAPSAPLAPPPLPSPPAPPPPTAATVPAPATVKSGTGTLEQITVNPDGKIEFKVGGLKFPLKDSRGAETVAGLFAPETGITAAHLSTPIIYSAAQLGVMYVQWVKPDKYYDVVRVHR